MLRAITVAALLVGFSAGNLVAQERVQFGYFAGFTAETLNQSGLAAGLSATVPTPISFAALRLEGMFQQARVRDIFVMANVLVTPLASRPTFYGTGGYGFFLDGGGDLGPINWAWNAGAGVDLAHRISVPIFIEYRTFFARDQFSALTFGVHF